MEGRGDFFEGRGETNVETAAELRALRDGFFGIVMAGEISELVKLLQTHPQRAKNGELLWLLTSGMAVELATGYRRKHHDLDIVVMDPNNLSQWEILGTDNVTPRRYWADMNFDYTALANSAYSIDFNYIKSPYKVEIVHPAIIMTQKLSNAFSRKPRDKDVADAVSIARWWEGSQGGNATWINHVVTAHAALPNQREMDRTEGRIAVVATELFPR